MRDPFLAGRIVRSMFFIALVMLGLYMWRIMVPSGHLQHEIIPGGEEVYRYTYGVHIFGAVLNTTMLSSFGLLVAVLAAIAALVSLIYAFARQLKWMGMHEDERLHVRWHYREMRAIRKAIVEKSLDIVDILGDGISFKREIEGETYEVKKLINEYLKDLLSITVSVNDRLVFRGDMEKNSDYFLGQDCNYSIKKYVLGKWERVIKQLAIESEKERERWRETERMEVQKKRIDELKDKLGEK